MLAAHDGGELVPNVEPGLSIGALERYLNLQGRFKKSELDPGVVADPTRRSWERLRA